MSNSVAEFPRWLVAVLVAGTICFLTYHPSVLAFVLVAGATVVIVGLMLGSFIFYLREMKIMPPWWAGLILVALCFAWPDLLGIVVGIGFVGALYLIVLSVLESGD